MVHKYDFCTAFIIIVIYVGLMGLSSIPPLNNFECSILRMFFRSFLLLYLYIFGFLSKEKKKIFSFKYLPFFIILPFSNYFSLFFRNNVSFSFSFELFFYLIDCLLISFFEEAIFRSIILSGTYNEKTTWKYIIFSSLLFSFSHLLNGFNLSTLIQLIYTFGLGVILSSIYYYGGGFFYSFLLHFMFNFFNGYLFSCFNGSKDWPSFIICNVVIGAIMTIYYFVLVYLRLKSKSKS